MKKIGFIGLGTMGTPMVRNLLKAGFELVVFDQVAEQVKRLVAEGAAAATSPAEVARRCEAVVTMLPADAAVRAVALGADGIAEGAKAGLIVIDSSTVLPATSRLVAEGLAKLGVETLDAPVTGSEPQAVEGKITFIVGGKAEIYAKCAPLFEAMGKDHFHMGPNGAGAATKLANNTISAITLVAYCEGLVLATKAGIDPALFTKIISIGGARSGQIDNKGPKVLAGDFHPNFMTALMFKDLGLAGEVARELNVPTPAMAIAREMLNVAMAKGYGKEDVCSVIKCYEEWAHTEARKPEVRE